jgi:hypothetical protein
MMQILSLPGNAEVRAWVVADIRQSASLAAEAMEAPAADFFFRPTAEFKMNVEHVLISTDGNLRLCLSFLVLIIKDITENLAGDVPYDALGVELDTARANDLASTPSDFSDTFEKCSALAAEYFSAIERLNRREGS